jgi:hypothetical protein
MDNHEQLKDKVRLIFNSYKNDGPVMEIYQIKGEWIMGPSDEIGYKIMEHDPKGMIKNALTSNEWFVKLMEAIAYADLNGFDVPKEAREIDAKYKLDPNKIPKSKGGRPKDMKFITCVRAAMLECINADIQPTKNETSGNHVVCGADIIWDVLYELGMADDLADSTAIMRIWFRECKRFPV